MNQLAPANATDHAESALAALRRHWGYDAFRPLQAESITATLAGRDVVTVMPTGGGKSLCFQIPPLVSNRLTIVVSPLIALMQDQAAALELAGVHCGAIHSHTTEAQAARTRELLLDGTLRLLYVAPERLLQPRFTEFVRKLNPGGIAIDEAHCISQWGHDFRPEYRRLANLRNILPGVPIGAYTATATPRVRVDIAAQLGLRDHTELVGCFDRPNLTYRVQPRSDALNQIALCLRRHVHGSGADVQAAIVYCLSRKETERVAASLRAARFNASAYHAGLPAAERSRVSDAFRDEKLDVVVATVAFGMGIDRGDVRCVIHATMPKSIEHYQQETGRAGRDGLPAECLLLYSGADVMTWKQIMTNPQPRRGEEQDPPPAPDAAVVAAQLELLNTMQRLATGSRCRHRALSEYFGQPYVPPTDAPNCGACDVCLGELNLRADGHEVARKIISCVARCDQAGGRFGAGHLAAILTGSKSKPVTDRAHDQLSTFGLLAHLDRDRVIGYIHQLVDAGDLARTDDQYPVVTLTDQSASVLKNQRQAQLVDPKFIAASVEQRRAAQQQDAAPLTIAEEALRATLRAARKALAAERGLPPFTIFNDVTLEELCRVRPASLETLVTVHGLGPRKAETFGPELLAAIAGGAREAGLALDAHPGSRPRRATETTASSEAVPKVPRANAIAAFPLFRRGASIEDVSATLAVRPRTVADYLEEFIRAERPAEITPWVDQSTYDRVADAVRSHPAGPLRPIFDALLGEIPYETIRLVKAHRQTLH